MLTVNHGEFMFENKYRPGNIDECILPEHDKKIFKAIIKSGRIPNIILHSPSPGTGKTTVARALVAEIDAEFLFVNGADAKIDFVRDVMTPFASSKTFCKGGKVIIVDEFDRAGLADSQRHLRSFMEAHSKNCTFIITANDLGGIIPALQSRCRVIQFGKADQSDKINMMKQMIVRAEEICAAENIEVEDRKVIAALVKKNFPDFRKTVNEMDFYASEGKIDSGILSLVLNTRNDIDQVVEAIKARDIKNLRAMATQYTTDYSGFVSRLANTLYPLANGPSKIRMYEIIGENNQLYGQAANIEIHVQYMFVQLSVEMVFA
ncbi:replication factor C small subunit [Aeromonas phage SW69-9]|nr:replication factor C small subunit [Aeromonas phage SW69-9]